MYEIFNALLLSMKSILIFTGWLWHTVPLVLASTAERVFPVYIISYL